MVLVAATASAMCYGLAMVLQHGSARDADPQRIMRLGILGFLGRRPLWWIGIGANLVALTLRLLALANGSLIVVQVLLASSLLLALPVSAKWHRQHLDRMGVVGASCVAVGSVVFVRVVSITDTSSIPPIGRWCIALGVGATCALLFTIVGNRSNIHRATFYAIAGGFLLAMTGALMKAVTDEAKSGLAQLLTGWPLYVLAFCGLLMTVVVQSCFAAGPLVASLPALMTTEILGTSLIAVAVFHENIMSGSSPGAGITALTLLAGGVFLAARSTATVATQERTAAAGADAVR